MRTLQVKFERKYLKKNKTQANYVRVEKFEEHIDKEKEKKRMPYPIASNKHYKLWKFFMNYDHIQKSMVFLENPRYAVRKGQQWFNVTEILDV